MGKEKSSKKSKKDLPENLALQDTRVVCNADVNHHVSPAA